MDHRERLEQLQTSGHFSSAANNAHTENSLLPTAIVPIKHRGICFELESFCIRDQRKPLLHVYVYTLFFQNRIIDINGIVVPKITLLLQNFFVPETTLFDDLHQFELADPFFHSPRQVDLLLGSNVIPSILLEAVKDVCNFLIAQATIFHCHLNMSIVFYSNDRNFEGPYKAPFKTVLVTNIAILY